MIYIAPKSKIDPKQKLLLKNQETTTLLF